MNPPQISEDPILDAFKRLVEGAPDRALLVCRKECVTALGLERQVEAVQRLVDESALEPGSTVALAAATGAGFFSGYLGIRRAGHRVLLVDWPIPPSTLDRTMRILGSAAALVVGEPWPRDPSDFRLLRGNREQYDSTLPDEVSTIRLTSGSTGEPRGIAHTSEALLNDDLNLRRTMELRDETALVAIPLSHAYGFASLFLPVITCGWTLVIPRAGSPFAATDAARAGAATFFPTVPAYLNSMLKLSEPPPMPASLRTVISAGAPLSPETARRFRRRYGLGVHVFYGASEVGGIAYDRTGKAAERGAVGTPVDGVRVMLESDGRPDPLEGTVVVMSNSAAVGYVPEPAPNLAGGRFVTSDVGRFDDGELVLVGRVDDVINVRGKKVWPKEIESLFETIPGVEEAVALRGKSEDGSGDQVNVLVATGGAALSEAELLVVCRSRLEGYKVPRRIRVVDEIPRNPRGKRELASIRRLLSMDPE